MLIEYVPPTAKFDVLICAIHAGVEIGTGDVAREIHASCPSHAGLYVHSCPRHITSRVFHEPLFDIAVRRYKTVISIHGMRTGSQMIHVGGRDRRMVRKLRAALGQPLDREPPPHLAGKHATNVVNRGADGAGVQIEIHYPLLFEACPLRSWLARVIAETLINCQ